MESLEGKLNKLNSAWQSFATNTVNSDFVKGLLDIATSFLKIADAAGGLVPILTTLVSTFALLKAGSIAKGISDIKTKFDDFGKTINTLGGGFKGFQLALAGVEKAEDAAKISTLGLATAAQTLTSALGIIGIVIGVATTAYNLYVNAQKEATAAAIESSQKAGEEIQSKKEKIKTTEDEIQELTKERDLLLKAADAGGENAKASKNLAQDKQEEIEKRQMNIDKMKEENAELLKQREAAIRSMSVNKSDKSLGWLMDEKKILDDTSVSYSDYKKEIKDVNQQLKEADGNTGAYKRTVESLIAKYEEQAQQKEKNNKSSVIENNIIKELNNELEQNAEKYDEDAKVAKDLYDIMLNGADISQKTLESGENALEYMQKFFGFTEEQIEQIKNHIDVLGKQTQKTKEYIDAVGGLSDEQKKMQDHLRYTDEELKNINEDIDNTQSAYATLTSAVDEYNSSGGISMDTLQQLLALDGEYLSSLELVNGKLQISAAAQDAHNQAMQADTLALIENAAMEDLMAMATEGAGSTASAASSKIYGASENAKKAGDFAKEGAAGFRELAASMAEAGMIDPNKGVNTEAWANKWAGITEKIKGLTSGNGKTGGVTSPRFTGSSSKGSKGKGGGGSKGKKSSKAKEEYKAEVDALYWYKNALDNAEESVDKLNDALKNTDNFNEQEKYIRQLIDATNNQINKTNDLKNAQVGQINNFINQLRQQGFAIDYNAQSNELYINNMQHLSDLTGDAAKNAEKLLDKIQDLNDDNRDLDGSIRDLTADVKDYYEQLEDIPEKKLEKFNDLMEEFQQSYLDQVQYQIEDLEHAMENDERLKALNEQIEALEKQNDEVDKQKEMEEKLLAVEEAKLKLENARNQKTMQVYREGQGFVWEADFDAIKDAEEELKDAQDDLNQQIRDDQLEQLEAEKEAIENSYQDRIDALQNFLDEQEYLIDKANREGVQSFEELRNELKKYGLDSAEYLGKATDWLNNYNNALGSLNTTVQDILASSGNATSELVYSSAMQDRINQALSGMVPNVQQNPNAFGRSVSYDRITNDNQSVYINSIELPNVHNTDEFIKELKNLPRMAASNAALRK